MICSSVNRSSTTCLGGPVSTTLALTALVATIGLLVLRSTEWGAKYNPQLFTIGRSAIGPVDLIATGSGFLTVAFFGVKACYSVERPASQELDSVDYDRHFAVHFGSRVRVKPFFKDGVPCKVVEDQDSEVATLDH